MSRIFSSCVLFFCLAASVFAVGRREEPPEPEPVKEIVRITGTVRLVGSASFSELVIAGDNKQWYVSREEMSKLMELQHRVVTLECVETIVEMQFANGRSAGVRYILSDIRIVAVE